MKDLEVSVVLAFAAVLEDFRFLKTLFDVGFADVEYDDSFDFVTCASGDGHDLVFLALPASDRGKNEGVFEEVASFEIGQDPFVEDVGRDEIAGMGIVLFGFGLHGTDDHARGEEFGIESFGESDALSVFAGHG